MHCSKIYLEFAAKYHLPSRFAYEATDKYQLINKLINFSKMFLSILCYFFIQICSMKEQFIRFISSFMGWK